MPSVPPGTGVSNKFSAASYVTCGRQKTWADNSKTNYNALCKSRLQLVTGVWQDVITCAVDGYLRLSAPLKLNYASQECVDGALLTICGLHSKQFTNQSLLEDNADDSLYCCLYNCHLFWY